jgi:hypothetical protein
MDEGGEVMDKQEQERLRDIASDIRGMYAALFGDQREFGKDGNFAGTTSRENTRRAAPRAQLMMVSSSVFPLTKSMISAASWSAARSAAIPRSTIGALESMCSV